MSSVLERIVSAQRELENKIVAVCVKCPHAKFVTGHFECQVAFRHCHYDRVKKWRRELEKI